MHFGDLCSECNWDLHSCSRGCAFCPHWQLKWVRRWTDSSMSELQRGANQPYGLWQLLSRESIEWGWLWATLNSRETMRINSMLTIHYKLLLFEIHVSSFGKRRKLMSTSHCQVRGKILIKILITYHFLWILFQLILISSSKSNCFIQDMVSYRNNCYLSEI